MSRVWTGGCACGAVRYEIAGEPIVMSDCQCLDCQKESGTGHGSYLTFPRDGVTVTGRAASWDMRGDSGNIKTRHFCATCGVPVYMTFAAMPDLFTVRATGLDEPDRYQPQVVFYASRGRAWDRLDPAVPTHAGMPG